MGILILPLIASMSEDALSAVPRSLREAGYSLGSTKIEVALKMVVPAAFSGISAACLLGISPCHWRDHDRRSGCGSWPEPDPEPIPFC